MARRARRAKRGRQGDGVGTTALVAGDVGYIVVWPCRRASAQRGRVGRGSRSAHGAAQAPFEAGEGTGGGRSEVSFEARERMQTSQ